MSTQAVTATLPELRAVSIDQLKEHPLNARKVFDAGAMGELAQSIRDKGIQTPLLVRPNGKGYEIIAGHRRFRCAQSIALDQVPVLVRQLDDDAALELMLIDNLQRADLHPLEEADGYRQLMGRGKLDVGAIADRVGRSVKYVYDRIKLLQLSKEMQQLFRTGEITAGHAIIIARLSPADQKRLLDEDERSVGYQRYGEPPLFTAARDRSAERRSAIKASAILAAQRLFPTVSLLRTPASSAPSDGMAEALLLAEFGRRRMSGGELFVQRSA